MQMEGKVRHVNDTQLEEILLKDSGWVIVALLDRCSIPCEHFWPEYRKFADSLDGKTRVLRMDVSENPTITDQLGVTAVPTTMLFKNGEEEGRYEGPYSNEALSERVAKLMSKGKK
jgi:thioredoxin 1